MSENLDKQSFTEKYAQLTKRWLTPKDLELEYGFSRSSQAKMRMPTNNSNLPFSKIGKYIRYDRIALDKWLEDHCLQGVEYV